MVTFWYSKFTIFVVILYHSFWRFYSKNWLNRINKALYVGFQNFFFFARLIESFEGVHAKFHDFPISQTGDIKFWMCYEKCVHTLSRSCHAVCHSDLTSHMIPGGPPWGMVWKSMKFCAQVQNFKTIALSVQEIWAFLLLHALKCEHISHSSVRFSWSLVALETLDGQNETLGLKSQWICLWECLM